MDGILRTRNELAFIDLAGTAALIDKEGDLNDLLSLCYTHACNLLLMDEHNLSDDFFNLKTGIAGLAMQKFANYKVKVAVILPPGADHNERFRELMYEMNQSNLIRFYFDRDEAEEWLISH